MKSIRKLKSSAKAVAGTALLVGATLTGAAGMAAADNHQNDLGDYPTPFVDEDGEIQSTIVVGESAKTIDVVGAINIAGSLGQDAYETTEKTVSGSGGTWSASNGATLDTSNDQLHFLDQIDSVRSTLTSDDLSVLENQEVLTGDEQQDVEQYVYLGGQQIQFGQPGDLDDEDPQLYVNNPTSPTVDSSYLYQLQANFQDGVQFEDTSEDDNKNEDVYGEEISLFGMDFTVAEDSFTSGNEGQLVLYGSQQETSVSTGESTTITIDGEEHTFEVIGVTGSDTAAIEIDGDLDEYNENDEEEINGETVRIDNIIQTNADNSQGTVQFAIGSEKLTLEDGSEVMTGSDEEEVDGTDVQLEGVGSSVTVDGSGDDVELSSIKVAVGADDSDNSYVIVDEAFEDPVFESLSLNFGGLNPNAVEDGEEIEVSPNGDEDLSASFNAGGESASVDFFHRDTTNTQNELADSDGDKIVAVEGDIVQEDEYVVTDAGDFGHLWEVTDVDVDTVDLTKNGASGDEATVELEDVVSGASVELDLDADGDGNGVNNDDVYEGEEVIDGQTYHVTVDTKDNTDSSTYDLKLTWGTDADFGATGSGSSGVTTAFPTVKTDSGARVTFYDSAQEPTDFGTTLYSFGSNERFTDADHSGSYNDGEAVINSGDTTLSSGDTVVTAGSADLTAFATTDYVMDGSGTNDDLYDDGEAVFDSSDGQLDSGDSLIKAGKVDLKNFDASDGIYVNDENNANGDWDSGEDIVYDNDGTTNTGDTVILYDGGTQNADGTNDALEVADGTTPYNDLAYIDADHDGVYDYTSGGDGEAIVNLGDGTTINDGDDFTASYSILAVPSGSTTGTNGAITGLLEDWTQMSTLSINFAEDGTSGYDGTEAIVDDDNGDGLSTLGAASEVVTSGTASITEFGTGIKHDNSNGDATTSYEDGDNIVDDSGTVTDEYDSGDTVITGSLTDGTGVQYWSSDSSETSGVSGLRNILPDSNPGLVVIEDEADDDVQESYTVSASWNTDQLEIDSPSFSDSSNKRQSQTLESDDDVTASYDQYGVYTEYNNDEQGSFTLNVPAGQSTAGAAVTGNDGSLSASGGSGSVEVNTPVGFPDSAALDSDSGISSAKENDNMILVGGPAVNTLTQELADNNETMSASEYSEGEGLVQLVNGAFAEGKDALVVAGYSGEDTRQAANYISNYASHSSDLSGQDQVTVSTQ